MQGESLGLEPVETKDRDMAPSCQIPWAILHQIFVKLNHTRLSEDVQNQQRSREMTMIHRVLIMNIIHVLAHGATDEVRPSDMDNKFLYMLAFSPVFPDCQMYIWLYIHIYNPNSLPSCWVILSIKLFRHDFHTTDYNQADWQELRQPSIQALIWYLDVFINTFINLCILVESYMLPHRMITQLRTVYSKILHNCYWYTDYMHCSWINNALVTRHETWSAYGKNVWLTVTSSLRTYPILIN